MAANPIYIETEEEIPEVIERVRRTPAEDATLVLPSRSRFGQSRFNFQLLKQYTAQMGKRVAIVSPDPAVQQMAEESGFRTFRAVEQLDGIPEPELIAAGPVPGGAGAAPERPRSVTLPPPRPAAGIRDAAARLIVSAPARLPSKVATEMRPGFALLYVGAGLVLIAGLVAGLFYLPSADVTLTASATSFSQPITIDAAPGQPPVKVRAQTQEDSATSGFKATGIQKVPGTVATGTVVYANQCFTAVSIPDGVRLRGVGGIQFTSLGSTQINPNSSASLPIKATSPGANGNLGAGTINVIDEPGSPGCLHVNNPDPTGGGQDEKQNTIIQPSDLEAARQALETQLRKQITDELSKQVQPGEKLGETPVFSPPDFNPDHKLGDVVGGFNATMKLKAEGAYYSTDELQKAFTAALAKKVPADKTITDNKVATDYTVDQGAGGHLTFKGTAKAFVAPKIDFNRLSSQLAATSTGQARAELGKLPVESASIKQSPFRLPFMPLSSSRIHISYVVQEGTTPTTVPSPSASPHR